MAEWFKAHAWKACVGSYPTLGSNPSLSANFPPPKFTLKNAVESTPRRKGAKTQRFLLLTHGAERTGAGPPGSRIKAETSMKAVMGSWAR